MSQNFINIIDALEKQWDAKIVPAYEKLKQHLLSYSVITKPDAQKVINELRTHYRNFFKDATIKFTIYAIDESDRVEAKKFLKRIEESFQLDSREFAQIYKGKAAKLTPYFFHKEAAAQLPMPTFEEQYEAWEIFPSDPETHPQYYTCEFK